MTIREEAVNVRLRPEIDDSPPPDFIACVGGIAEAREAGSHAARRLVTSPAATAPAARDGSNAIPPDCRGTNTSPTARSKGRSDSLATQSPKGTPIAEPIAP